MKATLKALEGFKIWCKILTFLFHNSPQLLVAGDQLFCKSVWPPEELNAYNFPVTKSILNARYQGQNNKIRQCSAELMGDASLIMLWMSTKNAQVALRNICTVSGRKTPQLTLSMFSFCCESRASTQVCVFSHLLILTSLVSVLRNFRNFNLDLNFF